MAQIGEMIASAGAHALLYSERLLKDLPHDRAARFATPGGVTLKSNHPAFVFGHLALYPAIVLKHLNQPTGPATLPAGFEALFAQGVECQDDPQASIYPAFEKLTSFYFSSTQHVLDALKKTPDSLLIGPNPSDGRMKERFPLLGGMLTFYLSGHPQIHLGQVSAWRRAIGLPPA